MSIKSRIIPALIALLAAAPAASANFTRIVLSTDTVILNQTMAYATSPHTPLVFFLIMLSLGLIFLAASRVLTAEQGNDICGYLAPIPLLFATIMSLGIDIKTSSAVVASVSTSTTITIIENHTIYTIWLLFIFTAILTIISFANILVIQHAKKEIKAEEQKREGYKGEY